MVSSSPASTGRRVTTVTSSASHTLGSHEWLPYWAGSSSSCIRLTPSPIARLLCGLRRASSSSSTTVPPSTITVSPSSKVRPANRPVPSISDARTTTPGWSHERRRQLGSDRLRLELGADLERGVDEGQRGRRAVAVAVPRERDQTRRHLRAEVDLDDRLVVRLQGELRDERRAHARAHEPLHGAVVVGAEDEVEALPQHVLDPRRAAA